MCRTHRLLTAVADRRVQLPKTRCLLLATMRRHISTVRRPRSYFATRRRLTSCGNECRMADGNPLKILSSGMNTRPKSEKRQLFRPSTLLCGKHRTIPDSEECQWFLLCYFPTRSRRKFCYILVESSLPFFGGFCTINMPETNLDVRFLPLQHFPQTGVQQ